MDNAQATGNGQSYGRSMNECSALSSQPSQLESVGGLLNETDKITAEIEAKAIRLADVLSGPIPQQSEKCKPPIANDVRNHIALHRQRLFGISEELSRALRAIEG